MLFVKRCVGGGGGGGGEGGGYEKEILCSEAGRETINTGKSIPKLNHSQDP